LLELSNFEAAVLKDRLKSKNIVEDESDQKVYKSGKWQKYKYATAAIIVIIVFSTFLASYIAVAIPAEKPLNVISITNYIPPEANSTNLALISFSTGTYRMYGGEGYLNIANTGDQNLTLTLTMSATVTAINQQQTNYNLGSIVIPKVTVNAHSSKIIPATLNDTTPIVHWTQKPSGYWGYSWSVQASSNVNFLFFHPAVGYKTFEFNGFAIVLG